MPLLTIQNLQVGLKEGSGTKNLIQDLSFEIPEHKIVALVGGSGSGKTMTGLSILRLLPYGIDIQKGRILFEGRNLLEYPESRMQKIRGKEISMIFQEPLSAFNPVFSVGYQIDEVLKAHTSLKTSERKKKILELLLMVGIEDPQRVARYYPHELSGGMRQRVMIALAIAANPKLIIADEPTSNLDVMWQAHIIELFRKLKSQLQLSMLLITHDFGVVSQLADQVVVLSMGEMLERNTTREIWLHPQHAYTKQLLEAVEV